eukprot:COSAG02_NODE_40097_length_409_cov_0.861290_1_plen_80_part_00
MANWAQNGGIKGEQDIEAIMSQLKDAVIVKASGSVALANQDIQDSWQWLASGFSGSVIQEFKIGPGGGGWLLTGNQIYL